MAKHLQQRVLRRDATSEQLTQLGRLHSYLQANYDTLTKEQRKKYYAREYQKIFPPPTLKHLSPKSQSSEILWDKEQLLYLESIEEDMLRNELQQQSDYKP